MLVKQGFDERFVDKITKLKRELGEEVFELDGIGASQLDICQFAKKFFKTENVSDVSTDSNSNVDSNDVLNFEYEFTKSLQKLNGYYLIWKELQKKYSIRHANKILELLIGGSLKLHDQHHLLKPYCYAFSLAPLVQNGMPFIEKVKIGKPKHFKSFVNLVIQLTAYISNQIAGAAAFPDLFVYMDWFLRKEYGEDYLTNFEVRGIVSQEIQSLVYSLNFPFRGSQSAFTNVSMYDDYFLKDLFSNMLYPDMSAPNFESIKTLQMFYMEWFLEESRKQTLTFPINTVTMYKDDDNVIHDKDFLGKVSELNAYNGAFNIYTGPLGSLSSCCRLRNDLTQVREYMNTLSPSGVSIGSHRVVTINLPRIAFDTSSSDEYMKVLDDRVSCAQDILDCHRDLLNKMIAKGRLPLYKYDFMHIKKQFSTVGIVGVNEACEIAGYDIVNDDGCAFARRILDRINDLNDKRKKLDGHIRNMEQIPAESAAIMFAKKDRLKYSASPYKLYSNQYIPLGKNVDIHARMRIAGIFDSTTQGGSIAHINVTDSITPDQMRTVIETSAGMGVIYFCVNMAQARCDSCNQLFIGKFDKSPCCNATVTEYLRVVGFLTPVKKWSKERRDEYKQRQFYEM